MAMVVPKGDPFAVDQTVGPTQEFGLIDMPKTQFSRLNASKSLDESAQRFNKVAQKWQGEQDQTRAKDLMNQIQEKTNDLTNNPETGFKTLKGINAIERPEGQSLSDEVGKSYDDFVNSLLQKGVNKNVQKIVKQFSDANRNQLINSVNTHLIAQSNEYRKSVNQKSIEMASSMALSEDQKQAEEGVAVLRSLIDQEAKEKGIEPDYTKKLGDVQFLRIQQAVDAGRLGDASNLLQVNRSDMSATDQVRAKRLIQVAARNQRKQAAENVVGGIYGELFSPENQAKHAVELTTGSLPATADYEMALALADGDDEKAVQILAYGVDRWQQDVDNAEANGDLVDEETMLSKDRNASMALSRYTADRTTEPTLDMVATRIKELVPDMDEDSLYSTSRKVLSREKARRDAQQRERDDQAGIAYGSLRNGNTFETLPMGATQNLKRSTIQALRNYSDRKQAGALVTNSSVYWDLINNDDKLKNMPDEDFVALAPELSDEDFDDLMNFRQGLKTGKFKNTQGDSLRRNIKDAFARNGLAMPTDEAGKAAYGYAARNIYDRIRQDMAVTGKEPTPQEISDKVTQLLNTEFSVKGSLWGTNERTLAKAIEKGSFGIDGTAEKILDAGLQAQGIVDPSKTNRTELLLGIAITPTKPVPGATAMVGQIRKLNPAFVEGLIQAYGRQHGMAEPDDSYIVRAYFQHTNLFQAR